MRIFYETQENGYVEQNTDHPHPARITRTIERPGLWTLYDSVNQPKDSDVFRHDLAERNDIRLVSRLEQDIMNDKEEPNQIESGDDAL